MKAHDELQRLDSITAIERTFWAERVFIAGMDEAGRGPLAGPVVAACVILPDAPLIRGVNDSKKLSEAQRERLAPSIKEAAIAYGVGWVAPDAIDRMNILNATRLAFKRAYEAMDMEIGHVLVDALKGLDISVEQHAFIHGDARSYLIGAASIIAKTERDAYMRRMHEQYPEYGFVRNKGYGTAEHIRALHEYGPCPIHRISFIRAILGMTE